MNETLRNRLIGLAVVLVVLFLLSWLIPRHPPRVADSGAAIPVTAVPVNGDGALRAPVAAATSAPPASSTAAPAANGSQNGGSAATQPPQDAAAAPASAPSAVIAPAPKPAPASTPAASSAPQPQPAATPAKRDSGGTVVVQVGSYSESANAEKVLLMLRKKGYRGDVVPVTVAAKRYYRVQVGPYADKASAEGALRRLSVDGFKGARVVGG